MRAPLVRAMVWLIRLYQRWISPALGPRCRFSPTCSSYAAQALTRHGLLRGLGLTTWRVLRCQPFSAGGLDPVPERRAPRSTAAQPPQPAQPARPAPTARPAPGPAPHLDPLRSAARSRS